MKNKITILLVLILMGCQTNNNTNKRYEFGQLITNNWNNYSLSGMSEVDFQLVFSKVRAKCNVEAYKLPIPAPVCIQHPKGDCSGDTGFALGFCKSYIPPMKCDYSAVNYAKNAQKEIFHNCMLANGWKLEWYPGSGTDVSGGIFEYAAFDSNNEYFIKLNTISKHGDRYSAVIR